MKVGVNLTPLVPGTVGGIRQLVLGLLEGLLRVDDDTRYIYFVNSGIRHLMPQDQPRVDVIELPWNSTEIEARGSHGAFDVLYAPLMDLGISEALFPAVSLLVDLQHNKYPEFFSEHELMVRRVRWEWSARASQFVCTISRFVADTVVQDLYVDPSRIVLTPPSLPPEFTQPISPRTETDYATGLRNRLPTRFLLFPANAWRHKNHLRLLEALRRLHVSGQELSLVLTGWPANAYKQLRRSIRSLGLQNTVFWAGYVPDAWMPLLYRDARALIFPSLYEGFGIPLLEAMRMRCPIACSATTSCPEVAGDAAVYFDPESPKEIASAIEEICFSEPLREQLVEAGTERSAQFTPEAPAQHLLEALKGALRSYRDPIHWRWPPTDSGAAAEIERRADLPCVSVIVPSYQQGRFIREAIDSILAQDYSNLEVIVIDGGSTDGTVGILKSFGDRILWVSEPGRGQAHALNKGLQIAKGEIIGWLNSYDRYLPGAIEKSVHALHNGSGCWLVYGEGRYINEQGRRIGRYPTDSYSKNNLLRHCMICQPSVFFHRRLYEIGGGVNEDYDMALDYELWLRYSRITPFLYIPEELACSRMYSSNKTTLFHRRSIRESMRACRRHYRHTSSLWCLQYARANAEHVPWFGSRRTLRLPFQSLLLLYALLRNEAPYFLFVAARYAYRALRS